MPEPRRPPRPASQLPIASSTWYGYVATTHDALLLLEAAKRGLIPRITRRLDEDERRRLVASGHIFIFDEREADIRRWTDGLVWSPSRILQNFLVYRQIERKNPRPALPAHPSLDSAMGLGLLPWTPPAVPTPPARRARVSPAAKATLPKAGEQAAPSLETDHRLRTGSLDSALDASPQPTSPRAPKRKGEQSRALSHVTSHSPFVRHGLCKKTISVECNGSQTHLIAYYSLEDVRDGRLRPPSSFPELVSLCISREFFLAAMGFRSPPHTREEPDGTITYLGEAFVGDIPASFLPDEYRAKPAPSAPGAGVASGALGPPHGTGPRGAGAASTCLEAVLGPTPPAVVSPSTDVPAFPSTLSPPLDHAAAPPAHVHAHAMGFGLSSPSVPHMSMLPSGVPMMSAQVPPPAQSRAQMGDARYMPQDDYAGVHYYSSPPSSSTASASEATPGSGSGPFFASSLGMYPGPYQARPPAYFTAPPPAATSSPKGLESKRLRTLPGMVKERAHASHAHPHPDADAHSHVRAHAHAIPAHSDVHAHGSTAHATVQHPEPMSVPNTYSLLNVVPAAPMWPAEGGFLPPLEGGAHQFVPPTHRSPSAPGDPN